LIIMNKEIRTLLIQPSYKDWSRKLPLSLAYLAAVLEKEKKFVRVWDLCTDEVSDEELTKFIKENRINLVGLTSTTPVIFSVWRLAKIIKDFDKGIKIVLGGPHPSALPGESLKNDFIDFVIIGEGEKTLSELIFSLEKKSNFNKIPGLAYKDNGAIKFNPPRKLITNLDEIPFPARHLFPFPQKYTSPGQYYKYFADILTSRGCPFSCTFCANKAVFGKNFRARSPENILEEIIFLNKNYGIKEIHISDDNFTLDKERAKKICELIVKNKLKIKWACGNGIHAGTIDEELVKYMKKSGCYRIGIGIESGNPMVLSRLGKQITLEQVEKVVNLFKKYKIITVGFFMFGNIGENEKTMNDTINFAKKLSLDYAQFFILIPFPGTPVFNYLKQGGYLLSEDWWDYRDFNNPVFKTEALNKDLLLKMYSKSYKEFYLRPSYVFKRIFRAFSNYYEFKITLNGLLEISSRIFRKEQSSS